MGKKRLGKGLSALINSEENQDQSSIDEIFVDQIEANPFQPRKEFEENALKDLADSIKEKGVIQPITLRKVKAEKYQIVAGERRLRASKQIGLKKIPAVIRNFDDQEMLEIALIENIQREDLNPIEEAGAYKEMLDSFAITQEELAERVGKSRSNISNMIRLLKLNEKIKNYLQQGAITIGHARALLSLKNQEEQLRACENVIIKDLTVRETEDYIDKLKNQFQKEEKSNKKTELENFWKEAETKLAAALKTKVKIKSRKKNNLLTIEIENEEQLEKILDKLN